MAKRFIVETHPRRFFAFASPSPLLPWNDPRQPPKDEPITDFVVRPFFGENAEPYALAYELTRLVDEVHRETAAPPAYMLVGRSTFLELSAVLMNAQEAKHALPAYSAGEGVIVFRGVPIIMVPGAEHFVEAVPVASWLLSRTNPKRFTLER